MKTNMKSHLLTMALAASLGAGMAGAAFAQDAFLPAAINSSTIPANGDVNPYGVAFVPHGFPSGGSIGAGDVLIANFNDSDNVQEPERPSFACRSVARSPLPALRPRSLPASFPG